MNVKVFSTAGASLVRPVSFFLLCLMVSAALAFNCSEARAGNAVTAANARQARELFNKVYKMTFGPQGSTLSYSVNIIGLYKTSGTIWVKGKKMRYLEPRYCSWCDGRRLYRVDLKKRTVELHNPSSPKRDKYLSRFTFDVNMFNYSWSNSPEGIVLNLDAKNGAKGIKHARVILNRTTHEPVSLKLKVAFFWTTIKISGYQSGGISDDLFVYPAAKFKSFKFTNMWPD